MGISVCEFFGEVGIIRCTVEPPLSDLGFASMQASVIRTTRNFGFLAVEIKTEILDSAGEIASLFYKQKLTILSK